MHEINKSLSANKKVAKRKTSSYGEQLFNEQKEVLAQALVNARIEQGLSQEALAYEAQVERSYVSLIERGNGNPSLRVLCQLAYRLGLTLPDILEIHKPLKPQEIDKAARPKANLVIAPNAQADMNVIDEVTQTPKSKKMYKPAVVVANKFDPQSNLSTATYEVVPQQQTVIRDTSTKERRKMIAASTVRNSKTNESSRSQTIR